ncbi:uncharacterized protein LOC135694461 [Rhopilema esculentum]|uniref:uncharacterized protein LOC135694461 n=1 Tax=Rhopilema esculentum TaxID=499914 RepID=UPI0031DF5348
MLENIGQMLKETVKSLDLLLYTIENLAKNPTCYTPLSNEIKLLLDLSTIDAEENIRSFERMKKELCDHLQICSLSGDEEFDVAMQYGEGLFKICAFKFDRLLAVDQPVDPSFQAPYLETGIKGVKRKREDEVATNVLTKSFHRQ